MSEPSSIPIIHELSDDRFEDVTGATRLVYVILRLCGPCTQRDLLVATHYTRPTIRRALSYLDKRGVLIESPTSSRHSRAEYRVDPGPLHSETGVG